MIMVLGPHRKKADAKAEARAEKETRAAARAVEEAEERDFRAAHQPGGKKERGRSENLDPEIEA
jgi:translation initiation factor IF-3